MSIHNYLSFMIVKFCIIIHIMVEQVYKILFDY